MINCSAEDTPMHMRGECAKDDCYELGAPGDAEARQCRREPKQDLVVNERGESEQEHARARGYRHRAFPTGVDVRRDERRAFMLSSPRVVMVALR